MAGLKPIRWGIVLTYRCSAGCPRCNRFLDVLPWTDSDLTLNDLRLGWERTREAGVSVEKVRVTGGEPLLHPRFTEAMELIARTWNRQYVASGARTCVFSNGLHPLPPATTWRYRVSRPGAGKFPGLRPPMVSPADLGVEAHCGYGGRYCHRQRGCGRLFDAFGFSFCIFAGPIGRLLGIDPYRAHPVLDGDERICKHCPFGAGVRTAFRLFAAVDRGEVEYPTATYRAALDRGTPVGFPRFAER